MDAFNAEDDIAIAYPTQTFYTSPILPKSPPADGYIMKPKVYFKTFGCRTNVFDSQVMMGALSDYEVTEEESSADIVIVNSCTVIADTQGMGVQGLIAVPIPLGSFAFGVIWKFERAYEFEPLDFIQSKATNVASAGVGPGNPLISAFLGYRIPVVGLR